MILEKQFYPSALLFIKMWLIIVMYLKDGYDDSYVCILYAFSTICR